MTSKIKYLILIVPMLFILAACVGGNDEAAVTGDQEIVIDEDYYEFQTFDLSPYDLPAFISLPDETANIGASKPEVKHTEDDIYWTINVGPNYQMIITDCGDIKDLMKTEKGLLAQIQNFKLDYIVDEEDLILYKRTLVVEGTEKASPTVGVEHVSYHVFGTKKIGGFNYTFKSRPEGYEKGLIELMAKSIKSIKPANK